MSKTVTVNVTAKHLADGRRESMGRSPIALAVLDAVPEATSAWEYHEAVDIWLPGHPDPVECPLPPEAQDFAFGFDDGDEPGPITFVLQVPDGVKT
jgi:hypothetical protein